MEMIFGLEQFHTKKEIKEMIENRIQDLNMLKENMDDRNSITDSMFDSKILELEWVLSLF